MRLCLAVAAGVLTLVGATPVRPEPLTLEVILGLERFGRVAIDPSGAIGVFEERRARVDLPRHDLSAESVIRQARLYRIDLDTRDGPHPLLPMAEDAGYSLGAFSPTGRRLVVYRLQDDAWSAVRVSGDPGFRREVWIQAQALGLEVQGHRPRERDRQAAGLEPRAPLSAEIADRMARAAVVVRRLIPDATLQTRLIAEALDRFQTRRAARDRAPDPARDRHEARDRSRSR